MSAATEHLQRAMLALEAAFLIGVEGVTEIWLVRHADCYRDMVEVDDKLIFVGGGLKTCFDSSHGTDAPLLQSENQVSICGVLIEVKWDGAHGFA